MLASLTVHLFPIGKAILPPTMGHYVHAAFLDILRQVNPEFAEKLHLDRPYKPFTVSPLQGRFEKCGKGKILIREGTECWIRFTILDNELLAVVNEFFLEGESSLLRLGNNAFQITRVTTDGNGVNGGWSARTTYESLIDSASSFDKMNLRFYSPTAFRVQEGDTNGNKNHIFPDPLHCFQSWLKNWNTLSPVHIDEDELLDFVQKHVRFSRYSIKTRIMNFGGYKQLGFVGDCEYQMARNVSEYGQNGANAETQKLLKRINTLANFAFYCGTGYKTTMGMGQTRRQDLAETG